MLVSTAWSGLDTALGEPIRYYSREHLIDMLIGSAVAAPRFEKHMSGPGEY